MKFLGGVAVERVLVVEDEVAVARSLERILRRCGVEVVVLHDPIDAAHFERVLHAEAPSVVLSDYLLQSAIDGVDVLSVAKRALPSARRCLLSGSLFLVSPARRDALEPCTFLDKPWDSGDLCRQLGLVKGGVS